MLILASFCTSAIAGTLTRRGFRFANQGIDGGREHSPALSEEPLIIAHVPQTRARAPSSIADVAATACRRPDFSAMSFHTYTWSETRSPRCDIAIDTSAIRFA